MPSFYCTILHPHIRPLIAIGDTLSTNGKLDCHISEIDRQIRAIIIWNICSSIIKVANYYSINTHWNIQVIYNIPIFDGTPRANCGENKKGRLFAHLYAITFQPFHSPLIIVFTLRLVVDIPNTWLRSLKP